MNITEFNDLIAEFRESSDSMANEKRIEYTESRGDMDVHANFKATATSLNIKPELVMMVFIQKHYSSLINFIKTGKTFSNESILSRITDLIKYLELLYAYLVARESQTLTYDPTTETTKWVSPHDPGDQHE